MIYLDHGATSFPKPLPVRRAVQQALVCCANPGRGGYPAAVAAMDAVYDCREQAAALFSCSPEQVVCTGSCTQGLNLAVHTLVQPGDPVVISGFEHNAVTRPLAARHVRLQVAGRKLFDWGDTLENWEAALKKQPKAAVFTCVSNVFGYIMPVKEMAALCRQYRVPFILDGAQAAGMQEINFRELGADFLAMPGHKGLLGPQGTGLLLCGRPPEPLLQGGTGSQSRLQSMPQELPDRAEPGTLNVPGIAGLGAGLRLVRRLGPENIGKKEQKLAECCARGLEDLGVRVFRGDHQSGTVSFVPKGDCEAFATRLADCGIAVRAGLHCAPLAHESAGTLETGTVRLSFGYGSGWEDGANILRAVKKML